MDMCIVPCSLAEMISVRWYVHDSTHLQIIWRYKGALFVRLKSAFSELDNPGELFLAICAEDSSIVYYKLSAGINKPPV